MKKLDREKRKINELSNDNTHAFNLFKHFAKNEFSFLIKYTICHRPPVVIRYTNELNKHEAQQMQPKQTHKRTHRRTRHLNLLFEMDANRIII